jgi:hypothetical protein
LHNGWAGYDVHLDGKELTRMRPENLSENWRKKPRKYLQLIMYSRRIM